jgi:hypothetical protein
MSRTIQTTSEPPAARVYLGQEEIGSTPTTAVVEATGPIENHTFHPKLVTLRLSGYKQAMRYLDYAWSSRNVALSIPFILGVPGVLYWSKLPKHPHVVLEMEAPPTE